MSRVALLLLLSLSGCTAVLAYPEIVEICDNGRDDDQDRDIDAADTDCQLVGHTCSLGDGLCERAQLSCIAGSCEPTCEGSRTCPAGWSCGADTVCACSPCVERCNDRDDDCDGRIDETTCAVGETCAASECTCAGRRYFLPTKLDLLFVLDDSGSMANEQAALRTALPAAITALSTGDVDGDEVADFAPIDSLHVAVVSTDLGVSPAHAAGVANCHGIGDDGVLGAATGCGSRTSFFDFDPLRTSAAAFVDDIDCALDLGTSGCGFTQPMMASLEAISPAAANAGTRDDYTAPAFPDGTGARPSTDFLRSDSTLAIVLLTDADDCSAIDPGLFTVDAAPFAGVDLRFRCTSFPDALLPVSDYVAQLFSLRRRPADVFFAAITGIPSGAGDMTPSEILALPAMQVRVVDTGMGTAIDAACGRIGAGADPARRLVQAADLVSCRGGGTALQSICDASFDDAFRTILRAVASAEDRRVCLTDP